MKLKDFLAGVLTGVAAGIVVSEAIDRVNQNVSADSVLKNVKDAFKKEGPIDGSWIVMKTEPYKTMSLRWTFTVVGFHGLKTANLNNLNLQQMQKQAQSLNSQKHNTKSRPLN